MDVERMLADIDGRLRRIEETLNRLTAAHGQLGRAMNATLFSHSVYFGDHRALTFLQNGQSFSRAGSSWRGRSKATAM
jgi:hypothetical protein